jgi:dihydroorotase
MTLPGFRHFVADPAKTHVLACLSAYLVGGLEGHYYPALYRPDCIDVAATVKVIEANRDLVKGIKAHAEMGGFARWGIEVMQSAAAIGQRPALPVYLHFGQLWPLLHQGGLTVDPDSILTPVLALMKPGDVLAHPFSRHPGDFVGTNGAARHAGRAVLRRGYQRFTENFRFRIAIRVGHGTYQ